MGKLLPGASAERSRPVIGIFSRKQTAALSWRSSICARAVLIFVLVWAIAVLVIHD